MCLNITAKPQEILVTSIYKAKQKSWQGLKYSRSSKQISFIIAESANTLLE